MQFSKIPIVNQIPKSSSVRLINLGCARNLVDSQIILGRLKKKNHAIVHSQKADVVILNTCAFIETAKKETIDLILELIDLKKSGIIKRIAVVGCFPERYPKQMRKEFKEVDFIDGVLSLEKEENEKKVVLTPKSYVYLKICESCYNLCHFCVIPKIKGKFVSRSIESITREAKRLDRKKIKEINIIGQDITAYGLDLYKHKALVDLLKSLLKNTSQIKWFRLLYAYPSHVTDELLDLMQSQKRICQYLDIPLQHVNDKILRDMNRHFFKKEIIALIKKIRNKMPECCLRTSFIVGYPGETEAQFKELCAFVRKFQFDRLGVFMYSREEGTKAACLPNQISEDVKQRRYDTLMKIQQGISTSKLRRFIGKKLFVVVDEEIKNEKGLYVGRSQYDAPEVDGVIYIETRKKLKSGDFFKVEIIDSYEYDLLGKPC
ncbi:MAG: 30S ribosomal protein S12 methylthiotransferase RimO [Candidatus Omnitrophica bacterium]|nr:30S ribosomal protein S12 methylthiotransferase RimO [Candidatus Omnitrophota bacterium]